MYGTVAYTAWGSAEAAADFKAKGGTAPAQTTTTAPKTTTQSTSTSNTPVTQTSSGQPKSAMDLIDMGYYGYAGWGDTEALANFRDTGGEGKGSAINKTLANYQDSTYQSSINPETRMGELKDMLTPETPKPATLSRVDEFNKLRTDYGVADLEKNLTDLKAQQDEQYAQLRINKSAEEGKPVAMNVIQGRMTEQERIYNEQADYLGRQVSRITDELNTKYSVISQFVNYMGLDYQDAVAAYDKEFAANIQMYNLVLGEQAAARSAYEYDQTAARANLQIYMNAISSGNMSYSGMDATQKLMVQKLEVQSGLPVGTIANMQMKPSDRILAFSEDKTQAMVVGENGQMQVISTGLKASATSGTAGERKLNDALSALKRDVQSGVTFTELYSRYGGQLEEYQIRDAYNAGPMAKQWGPAKESSSQLKNLDTAANLTQANINKAKQLVIQNGGTADDQKRCETDLNFVNYVIATYGS